MTENNDEANASLALKFLKKRNDIAELKTAVDSAKENVPQQIACLCMQTVCDAVSTDVGETLLSFRRFFSLDGLNAIESSFSDKLKRFGFYEVLTDFYSKPEYFDNIGVWLLFQSLMEAQSLFSVQDDNNAAGHEPFLAGKFVGEIKSAGRVFSDIGDRCGFTDNGTLDILIRDFQRNHDEVTTGTDVGLIIEYLGSDGKNKFLPYLFQAKRFQKNETDTDQKNSAGKYQLELIKEQASGSGYLFFENGSSNIKGRTPLPAIAKSTAYIELKTTRVFEQSLDFATYILDLIHNSETNGLAVENNETSAIARLYKTASREDFGFLIVISTVKKIQARYLAQLEELNLYRKTIGLWDGDENPQPSNGNQFRL